MKLLAASDLHGNHAAYRWLAHTAHDLAVPIVLAGDLLGFPDGYDSVEDAQHADAEAIFSLLAGAGVPVYYIWGNDDFVEIDPPVPPFISLHEERREFGAWNLVGYQHSLPFVGGRHEKSEEEIAVDLSELAPLVDDRTILVTHCPAFGILDRGTLEVHAGSRSILDLVETAGVYAHVHGHIHKEFGRKGKHFNVAASAESRAMLIDVPSLQPTVLEGPGRAA